MKQKPENFERDKAERRAVNERKRSREMSRASRGKGKKGRTKPRVVTPTRSFTRKERERFLEHYANLGTKKAAAEATGFNLQTINRHLKENPLFAEQFEETKQTMLDHLEAEAYRRAVEGVDEPVYYKGELIGYKKVYSDKLLSDQLTAHAPEKYGKNGVTTVQGNVSVSGPDGGPVEVQDAKEKLKSVLEGQAKDVTPAKVDHDEENPDQ